jgi:hypothetical protein
MLRLIPKQKRNDNIVIPSLSYVADLDKSVSFLDAPIGVSLWNRIIKYSRNYGHFFVSNHQLNLLEKISITKTNSVKLIEVDFREFGYDFQLIFADGNMIYSNDDRAYLMLIGSDDFIGAFCHHDAKVRRRNFMKYIERRFPELNMAFSDIWDIYVAENSKFC